MSAKRTLLTAGTSYLGVASSMITALLLIRLATQCLSREEMGLWSFCFGTVGYFLLMDFGVTNSLGRLFADAVVNRDHREMSRWLYLAVAILGVQGLFVLIIGLLSRDFILAWFHIPPNIRREASDLWTWLVCIQAAAMPFRALPGFRYAQNRVYHNDIFNMAASWLNLGIFWFFVSRRTGVMSYAYSALGSTVFVQTGYFISVFFGKDGLRLHRVGPALDKLPELFRYSSAIFVQSLATQMSGATQTMILTRIIGLDSVAVFSITSRIPSLLMQLTWKPFDACVPRWMLGYCSGDFEKSRKELILVLRITVLAVLSAAGTVIVLNKPFIEWWTRPEFFGGTVLTALIGLSFVTLTIQHCMRFAFHLSKRMGVFTSVLLAGFVVEAGLGILLVRLLGISGIPVASLAASLGFVFWFHIVAGGRTYGIPVLKLIRLDIGLGIFCVVLCAAAAAWFAPLVPFTGLLRLVILGLLAGILLAPVGGRIFLLGRELFLRRRVPQGAA